jgi:hypothetical protein
MVQFEFNPFATPFERRSIGEELALCQRYYVNAIPAFALTSNTVVGGFLGTTGSFPQSMRAAPTLAWQSNISAPNNCATPTGDTANPHGFRVYSTAIAAGTATFGSLFSADAEL